MRRWPLEVLALVNEGWSLEVYDLRWRERKAKQEQPILINCTSGPGRICRYTWEDGTVEWFTEADVHRKGLGRATRPE